MVRDNNGFRPHVSTEIELVKKELRDIKNNVRKVEVVRTTFRIFYKRDETHEGALRFGVKTHVLLLSNPILVLDENDIKRKRGLSFLDPFLIENVLELTIK